MHPRWVTTVGRHVATVVATAIVLALFSGSAETRAARHPAKPDLTVTSVSARLGTGTARVTAKVNNVGRAPAPTSDLAFYLSHDRRRGSDDVLALTARTPKLRPGSAVSISRTLSSALRRSLNASGAGAFFVVVCVDSRRRVAETHEGNNCRASGQLRPAVTAPVPTPPPAGPPGAPLNVRVTSRDVLAATLAWDPPTSGGPVDHYEVFNENTLLSTTAGTHVTLQALQAACINGSPLQIGVEAVDSQGRHSPRSTVSVMPLCGGGGGGGGGGGSAGGGGGGGPTTSGLSAPRVTFDATALPAGTAVQIEPVANPDPSVAPGDIGDVVEIQSPSEPVAPVTLQMPFDPSHDGPPSDVSLAWWSSDLQQWQTVPTTFDAGESALVARIEHFSIWSWVKKQVTGMSGDVPTCDGSAPPWATVNETAHGEFGIAGSCAGTTSDGRMEVRVISDHDGFSAVTFFQQPERLLIHGSPAPVAHNQSGWYALVPQGLVLEADFSRPSATPNTSRFQLYGYGNRDGLTYAADALSQALNFIPGVGGEISAALQGCYAVVVQAIDSQLPVDESSVLDCLDAALEGAVGAAFDIKTAVGKVVASIGFWKNVAFAARDFAEAVITANAEPAVIDAVLTGIPTSTHSPTITVDPNAGPPGASFQLSGSGFSAGDTLTIRFDGVPIGSANADGAGQFSVGGSVPPTAAPGTHQLEASSANGAHGDATFTVDAAGDGTSFVVSSAADGTPANGDGAFGPFGYSPDGTKVMFSSSANNLTPAVFTGCQYILLARWSEVYVKNLSNGNVTMVSTSESGAPADCGVEDATWSPDGTKIAFNSVATNLGAGPPGYEQLYVKDLTTGSVTVASSTSSGIPEQGNVYGPPVWSPDGKSIAFSASASNLPTAGSVYSTYVKSLTTGQLKLVATPPVSSWPAAWNANGKLLLTGDGNPSTTSAIYLADLTTDATTVISTTADGQQLPIAESPSWSPDGTRVAFMTANFGTSSGYVVVVKNLATGTLVAFQANGNNQTGYPTFSPDGTQIAFDADNISGTGALESNSIFAAPAAGGPSTLISQSPAFPGDYVWGFAWSPTSDRIAFATNHAIGPGPRTSIFVADAPSGAIVAQRTPAANSADQWPTWRPDGRQLLLIESVEHPSADTTSQIIAWSPG